MTERAEQLARALLALGSGEQRERHVVEWLRATDAHTAALTLHALFVAAEEKDSDAQAAVLSLVHLSRYEEAIGYDVVEALYVAATDHGFDDVKRLLRSGGAHRSLPRDGAPDNEFFERTLGERKALAMSTDRDVIDRLMRDRNPDVIRVLLKNPRLVEVDVVRIAAMRPTEARVLEEIVQSPKWIARYAVKKALVCNPYTPTNTALSLLPFLLTPDLRAVSEMATLDLGLRHAARDRL